MNLPDANTTPPASITASTSDLTSDPASPLGAWTGHAAHALAAETRRAYRDDWRSFTRWCQAHGLLLLPAHPATVADYLCAENLQGRAVATLRRRLATIACAHTTAGVPDPTKTPTVRRTLQGIARDRGTQQRQAPGLNQRDADKIANVLGTSMKDARDLAMLLVGRDLLARASELVSIRVEDIAFDEDGSATVSLRRHKTSTEALLYMLGPDATAALSLWLQGAQITTGLVFTRMRRGGKLTGRPISRHAVSKVLRALASRARIKTRFSSHSLRVGMAQDLTEANVETAAIMQAAGWRRPEMLARYTRKLAAKRGAISRYYSRR